MMCCTQCGSVELAITFDRTDTLVYFVTYSATHATEDYEVNGYKTYEGDDGPITEVECQACQKDGMTPQECEDAWRARYGTAKN